MKIGWGRFHFVTPLPIALHSGHNGIRTQHALVQDAKEKKGDELCGQTNFFPFTRVFTLNEGDSLKLGDFDACGQDAAIFLMHCDHIKLLPNYFVQIVWQALHPSVIMVRHANLSHFQWVQAAEKWAAFFFFVVCSSLIIFRNVKWFKGLDARTHKLLRPKNQWTILMKSFHVEWLWMGKKEREGGYTRN